MAHLQQQPALPNDTPPDPSSIPLSHYQEQTPHEEQQSQNESSSKRKRGEDGSQQKGKRNRYVAIACNECKRRKIKCNGEQPCQRCGNLGADCVYAANCCSSNFKETQEYKNMNSQVQTLQEQVEILWQSVNTLRHLLGHEALSQLDSFPNVNNDNRPVQSAQANMEVNPTPNPNQGSPRQSRYLGPTSSQYNFDLARSSLQSMGINAGEESFDPNLQQAPGQSASGPQHSATFQLHPSIAPIRGITKDEALRLCRVYEDEMGLMYPILDMKRISQYATFMFMLGDAVEQSTHVDITPGAPEPAHDADMEVLKLVLANALVAETGGRSQLAHKLFTSCSKRTVSLSEDVTLKNIQLLTLVSMYLFHSDQETRSWRMIGVAARLCIELGLHRSETYTTLFTSEDERDAALRLFWSIYVLDKRWSLGVGRVSALTESDIDINLDKPHDSSPYLTCMVDYSKIGSRVWSSFGNRDSAETPFNRGDAEYLNYQVLQWYKNIPEQLTYTGPKHSDYGESQRQPPSQAPRALYRLQVILYLRANQMRILTYRPVLHSATQMLSNDAAPYTQKVVDLARDSIRTLSRISQTSDIYQTQQMCFNYFLVSALAVLFLAVSHAPAQFASACRDEFYLALELVRGLSAQSAVSERLWRTIRGLKEIGPKLGLYQRQPESEQSVAAPGNGHNAQRLHNSMQNQQDATSSAAMAMAGLRAGRPVDKSDFFAVTSALGNQRLTGNGARATTSNPTSPNGMANDLMSLFEAAGAFASSAPDGTSYANESRAPVATMAANTGGGGASMAGGHEDDFGRIMRDLF